MPDLLPEQQARQAIDALLAAAGWAVQDYEAYSPGASRGVALREAPLTAGRCDYLLMVDRRAVGVVEAKKEGTLLSAVGVHGESLYGRVDPCSCACLPSL